MVANNLIQSLDVQLDGLQHLLKLRTRQQLRNNLFAELGADLSASRMAIKPRAALEYKVALEEGSSHDKT